jgi:hypothetical protein
MRWYFATDETGANGQTGEDARRAVGSALAVGGLEPCLLYYGAENEFCAWMRRHHVEIINIEPRFLDTIRQAQDAGIYRPHSIGHWLRLTIPQVEHTDSHVLYTDCDVMFLRRINWQVIRPKILAAAPAFEKDNWNYFNAGVIVLNVAAMRATYDALETYIRRRILNGDAPTYDDETALNEAYRGLWSKLDPALNWKPYWGFSSAAAVLHFHGPKLGAIEAMAAGAWAADNPTAEIYRKLLVGHRGAYQAWLNALGDRMQVSDPALAIRYGNAAASLSRMKDDDAGDMGFLRFRMFQE